MTSPTSQEELRENTSIAATSVHAAISKLRRKDGPRIDEAIQLLQVTLTKIYANEQLISGHYIAKEAVAADLKRAEGQGMYIAASMLSHHVGYLLAHRAQGLPSMTSEVIGNLWADIKKITGDNEQHMRRPEALNLDSGMEGKE